MNAKQARRLRKLTKTENGGVLNQNHKRDNYRWWKAIPHNKKPKVKS